MPGPCTTPWIGSWPRRRPWCRWNMGKQWSRFNDITIWHPHAIKSITINNWQLTVQFCPVISWVIEKKHGEFGESMRIDYRYPWYDRYAFLLVCAYVYVYVNDVQSSDCRWSPDVGCWLGAAIACMGTWLQICTAYPETRPLALLIFFRSSYI